MRIGLDGTNLREVTVDDKHFKRLDVAIYLAGLIALMVAVIWFAVALITGFDGLPPSWIWALLSFAGLAILGGSSCVSAWASHQQARMRQEIREVQDSDDWIAAMQPKQAD